MRGRRPGAGKDAGSAYDRGVKLLSRREHSQRELRGKLARSGHDDAESGVAVQRLQRAGFQSDERFGGVIARTRVAQGYGPARIRAELKTHGLADALIREQIDALDADWTLLARRQLRKRFGQRPASDPTERGKRAAFLLRRGFPAATVRTVTHAEIVDADD
ncbi:MAG: regulatory protein RecX [Lysobacterales bacterium]